MNKKGDKKAIARNQIKTLNYYVCMKMETLKTPRES
jgi:hypothetical protein